MVIKSVASAQIGDAGGDCMVHSATGDVSLGSIGGDCVITDVDGALRLGNVGSDAHVRAQGTDVQIGNIGGDTEGRAAGHLEEHITKPVLGYVAGFWTDPPAGRALAVAVTVVVVLVGPFATRILVALQQQEPALRVPVAAYIAVISAM